MSVSLKADVGGSVGSLQLNGADRLVLNADGTLSGTVNPATGLRSTALATMQKFADEFPATLAANGSMKFPNGLIINWGTVNVTVETAVTVTMDRAYTTLHIGGIATIKRATSITGGVDSAYYSSTSLTQAAVVNDGNTGATADVFWLSIGF